METSLQLDTHEIGAGTGIILLELLGNIGDCGKTLWEGSCRGVIYASPLIDLRQGDGMGIYLPSNPVFIILLTTVTFVLCSPLALILFPSYRGR